MVTSDIETNRVYTMPIDSKDQFSVDVGESRTAAQTVGLNIDGGEAASYDVYLGAHDGNGGIQWFL